MDDSVSKEDIMDHGIKMIGTIKKNEDYISIQITGRLHKNPNKDSNKNPNKDSNKPIIIFHVYIGPMGNQTSRTFDNITIDEKETYGTLLAKIKKEADSWFNSDNK